MEEGGKNEESKMEGQGEKRWQGESKENKRGREKIEEGREGKTSGPLPLFFAYCQQSKLEAEKTWKRGYPQFLPSNFTSLSLLTTHLEPVYNDGIVSLLMVLP